MRLIFYLNVLCETEAFDYCREDDHLNRLILEAEHIVSCVDALSPFSPALGRWGTFFSA